MVQSPTCPTTKNYSTDINNGSKTPKSRICCPKDLDSVFMEVMIPNKCSYILGTIYKHPSMKYLKFNNEYMKELFRIITHENKNCILTGDFTHKLYFNR